MIPQINHQLLKDWEKQGELLAVWRCDSCFKKVPFYKTDNPIINAIYLSVARYEKYCDKCKKKLANIPHKKKIIIKEVRLLKKYEGIIVEMPDEALTI